MINVSEEFRNKMDHGERNFLSYADVTLKDGKVLNLDASNFWQGGVSVEGAVSSESSFDIGSAIVNKCTLVINNIYDDFTDIVFENAKVILYIGMEMSNGTIEKIRKGTYTVDDASYNGSIITLSCLDNMREFDRKYSESTLSYPASLRTIVQDACTKCGIKLQSVTFPHEDFVIKERPSDEAITFREIISWCAQIACCFCRCDVYGRLELKWFDQSALENPESVDGYMHKIKSHYSAPVVSKDDVVITGVKILEKVTLEDSQESIVTYMSGTDGYVISIENNSLISGGSGQEIVNWLGQQLIGFKFRKAQLNHASDPTIEEGDVAIVVDRKGTEYKIVVSSTIFSTGQSQTTNCNAESPANNTSERCSSETKNYVELRKELKKEKTEREKALEELSEKLSESQGVFTTVEMDESGGKVFYLHNKPKLSESDMVWKMTAEAWGVSTDGGKTWNAGMTVDGDTITRILTATGINAGWINTGTFKVEKDGKTMFSVDVDTGEVKIVASSFSVGTKTVEQITKEEINNIQVGGRNLILGTSEPLEKTTTADSTNVNVVMGNFSQYFFDERKEGKVITLSFDWETTGTSGTITPQFYGTPWSGFSESKITVSSTNQSGRYEFTKTLKANEVDDTATYPSLCFRIDRIDGTTTFRSIKCEFGNKATDWSIAPEDTDADFENVRDSITQSHNDAVNQAGENMEEALKDYVDNDTYNKFVKETGSNFEQTESRITRSFTEKITELKKVDGEINESISLYGKYFHETIDGLEIVEEVNGVRSALSLHIDNDMIAFKKNGKLIGWWDGTDFHTGNIVVELQKKAQFGNFAFVPRSDGSLSLLKVGD